MAKKRTKMAKKGAKTLPTKARLKKRAKGVTRAKVGNKAAKAGQAKGSATKKVTRAAKAPVATQAKKTIKKRGLPHKAKRKPYLFSDILQRILQLKVFENLRNQESFAAHFARVLVEPPREASHGDIATNLAMVLAKEVSQTPRDLAELLVKNMRRIKLIKSADVAGPGFINFTLRPSALTDVLNTILQEGKEYGRSKIGDRKKVNVEFVSANPTGPMHVGHCRGAVYGDALANLLQFADYDVTREYYINDAGAQVDVLARSAFLRYREALGENIGDIPEGLYPGDYLKEVGEKLVVDHGDKLKSMAEFAWLPIVRQAAVEAMLVKIMDDLQRLNIRFDTYFSEKALSDQIIRFAPEDGRPALYSALDSYNLMRGDPGSIRFSLARQKAQEQGVTDGELIVVSFTAAPATGKLSTSNYLAASLSELKEAGLIFQGRLPPPKGAPVDDWEDREQTLFRATAFGDDVDRPLKKSDGSYTYFAADIAYHKSKFDRGFHELIDVWGADHGGYIKRMQAAVKAATSGNATLDVKIVQLVRLLRDGEPVKMSKRAGEFVTLRDVVEEVGPDAVRFMMLFRKNDASLDFDLTKVVTQSRDNPVFYVQYGHARGYSIFRNARDEVVPDLPEDDQLRTAYLAQADLGRLDQPEELDLLKRLALYPRTVEAAAIAHEPHRIAFYLYDLASEFHALWTKGRDLPHLRFIINHDAQLTKARLAMVQGVVSVLASGLAVLGVHAPSEMR